MPKDDTSAESESSKRTEGFEVAFLPWLGWKRKIAVGPVIFSPCELETLGEPAVREYLSRYFPRYVEVDGSPIEILVLPEHAGVTGFRYHTNPDRLALKRAAAGLAVSVILVIQTMLTAKVAVRQHWGLALGFTVIMVELFAVAVILPTTYFVSGLLLTIPYYVMTNIARHSFANSLTQQVIRRYAIVGFLTLAMTMLTAPWS